MTAASDSRDIAKTFDAALAAVSTIGTLELVAMGAKMGLTLECMADFLNKGAARNRVTQDILVALAQGQSAKIPLLTDLRGAIDTVVYQAMEHAMPLPIVSAASRLLQSGIHLLGKPDGDVLSLIEASAAVQLRATDRTQAASLPAPGNTAALRVGYVGLGAMGGALAQRLLQSRPLQVFDPQQANVARLVDAGASASPDLKSLAQSSDVIVLCLPTSDVVRQVLFGPGGLAEGLTAGKIVIDQTSGDPIETRQFAQTLAHKGIALVDAPVSGGPGGATAGTIAIMCAGEGPALSTAHAILRSISPHLIECGEVGNAHLAKLVNNAVSSLSRLLTYEISALAVKAQLPLDKLMEAIESGSGWSVSAARNIPAIVKGNTTANFHIGLMLKDVRLACKQGMRCGAPMALAHVVRTVYESAVHLRGATADSDELSALYEDMTGIRFQGA